MKKVVVIGEILVEIMADTVGCGFRAPMQLSGPYPSGAPAIFIDQVARLGQPCAIISRVGDDDFGRMTLDRLAADGVDVSAVSIDPDRPTGSAFVRYREDGARDFVFNIRHSASGVPAQGPGVSETLAKADHLHVMGSSLSGPALIAFSLAAIRSVRARGGSVSFDPNLRKEISGAPGIADAMRAILGLTDLYLPSGPEISLLTTAQDTDGAVRELLAAGVRSIVHKRGREGVSYHDSERSLQVKAFSVDEVDPTGAGDCFGGAFTTFWLRGMPVEQALTLAAAAGALAVTRRGPMEGACDLDTIRAFAALQGR